MVTATGYSGLWGLSLVTTVDRGAIERAETRLSRRVKLARAFGLALNGTAVGSNVTYTEKRIQASVGASAEQGGVRTIETNTFVNRNTTAADKTRVDGTWLKGSRPSSIPSQPGQIMTSGAFSGRGAMAA